MTVVHWCLTERFWVLLDSDLMTYRFTQRDWDQLLDGESHLVDVEALGLRGGVANVRALAHYQASKRRGTVQTSKMSATSVTIQGIGCTPVGQRQSPPLWVPPTPQEPAAYEGSLRSPSTDKSFGLVATNDDFDPDTMSEEEEEALLGPCTCGQRPKCLPTCARAR